jgi:HlyD family secretion protein
MDKSKLARWGWPLAIAVATLAGGTYLWGTLQPKGLPAAFASGNGRIEATEVDVATRFAGRVLEVHVMEGDFVEAGQVVARMDTAALEAQMREAEALRRQVISGRSAADAGVAQRESAKATARAVVAQRQADLLLAQQQVRRTRQLVEEKFIAAQQLDVDEGKRQSAAALVDAARSGVAEAEAAIRAAKAQRVEAASRIDAANATLERLRSDLGDAQLKAARSGRIQHRLAQAGEVLPGGGKVLTVLDLSDVFMRVYLPETVAGKLGLGAEARLVLDAAPNRVIPAQVSFVAAQAQFTPKTVETASERQKLVFMVKLQIAPALLKQFETHVKAGLPGVGYVRIDPATPWPEYLKTNLPMPPESVEKVVEKAVEKTADK